MSNSFKESIPSLLACLRYEKKSEAAWESFSDDDIKWYCDVIHATMSFQDFLKAYQETKTTKEREALWSHMEGSDVAQTVDTTPTEEDMDNARIIEAQKENVDFSTSSDEDTVINESTAVSAGAFPLYVFPQFYQDYINHVSNVFCVLPGAVATALLPVICAVSGKASVRASNDLKSYGNIFSVIVGNPGTGKTPLMSTVTSLLSPFMQRLQEINDKSKEKYKMELARYKQANKRKVASEDESTPIVEPTEPPYLSIYCANATMESRFQLLEDSPSLLQFSDELTSFVMGLNQYKQKGSDTEELLSLWNSSHIVLNRKNKAENTTVWNPKMSMLAAVSPRRLRLFNQYIDAETGLFDRFIFDFMTPIPDKEKTLIINISPETELSIQKVKNDINRIFETYYMKYLEGTKPTPVPCGMEALVLLDEANKRWNKGANEFGFTSKGLAHCLNFANVLCVIWQQKELTTTIAKFAISLTDYYLQNMKRAYFYATGKKEEHWAVTKIKKYALKKNIKSISVRMITATSMRLCSTVKEAQEILEKLVALQCGDWKELRTKREVVLNPSWLKSDDNDDSD